MDCFQGGIPYVEEVESSENIDDPQNESGVAEHVVDHIPVDTSGAQFIGFKDGEKDLCIFTRA